MTGSQIPKQCEKNFSAYHEYGGEVEFRAALESLIASEAHLHMKEKHSGKKIPIVVLVIGGGPRTVEQILSSLENSSPCVILEVSDDFLTFTFCSQIES